MDPRRFNEWLAKLENLDPSDPQRSCSVFKGLVWRLAASERGSRILQELLDITNSVDKGVLVQELHGHVTEAWQEQDVAPHANHVLQKCIDVMPPENCAFVLEELRQSDVHEVAHSKYGCRILQRLIEHFPSRDMEPSVNRLIEDGGKLSSLMISRFGNFVVQCLLEHGASDQKSGIAKVIMMDDGELKKLICNKYASHVVQTAMTYCSDDEQWQIVQMICLISSKDKRLKKKQFGSFVVTAAERMKRSRELPSYAQPSP